jgi:hypothetical protein
MSEPNAAPDLAKVSDDIRRMLVDELQRRGLSVHQRNELLDLDREGLTIRCGADKCGMFSHGSMVQATFEVTDRSSTATVISDTLVGAGESEQAAFLEAVTSWLDGVFPPIQAAVGESEASPDLNIFDISTIDIEKKVQTAWEAFTGSCQIRGSANHREILQAQLAEQPPLVTVLLNPLTDLLSEQGSRICWVKIFLNRRADGGVIAECKANGLDWPEGREALAEFVWPAGTEGMLFKQFAVLRRGDSRPLPPDMQTQPSSKKGCASVLLLGGVLTALASWIVTAALPG